MTKILQLNNSIKKKIDGVALLHLEDLRKSGLSDESIIAAGFRTIPPGDIARHIGYDIPDVNSAYEIPFDKDFSRVKVFYFPDRPPAPGEKRRKYHQKQGKGNRLYIPVLRNNKILKDTQLKLYIAEGEKKALCASQHGFPCIGITGLWNWKKKGTDELIPDFDLIALNGREIYLVPDSDYRDKRKNLTQAVELCVQSAYFSKRWNWIERYP